MIDRQQWKDLCWASQRCQRNWNLDKEIPKEDIDTMIYAIKSAPSKQNERHFQVSIITDYESRYKIYDATHNFAHKEDQTPDYAEDGSLNYKHQSQLIGNVLFVFSRDINDIYRSGESHAGGFTLSEDKNVEQAGTHDLRGPKKAQTQRMYQDYGLHSLGIGVGYLLLTAHLLGYKTGCSGGFDQDTTEEITGIKYSQVIVAVGFEDNNRDRTEEHFEPWRRFPSFDKDIKIHWV